jgi:dipeptidyl aminopeptidase/acylaminoacyl peptidase
MEGVMRSIRLLLAAGFVGFASLHGLAGQGVGIPGGVAFNTMRDGNAEIYVMDADGRSPTRLTNYAGIDQFPDWSPNGSEIVFRRDIDVRARRRTAGAR